MSKVLIFDCDGTVLDTFNLIEHIVLATFKEMLPDYPITFDEAHSFFGPYINDTFKKYEKYGHTVSEYISTYAKYAEEYTKIYIKSYPGIKEAFTILNEKGYKIVIVSNKISKEVYRGLKICGIDNLVTDVVGAECVKNAKPDPEGIYYILNKYNENTSIIFGDSKADIDAGINAGIKTCGVTWCKTTRSDFEKMHCDYILDNPMDIVNLVLNYGK